jgi:hypothetical protein
MIRINQKIESMKAPFLSFFLLVLISQILTAQPKKYLFPVQHGIDDRAGFIDTSGKAVIPFHFDKVTAFSENYAAVSHSNKWGFILPSGKYLIHPMYDYAWPFSSGVARVLFRDSIFLVNAGGGRFFIENMVNEDFSHGKIRIKKNGKFGYADIGGNIVIAAEYDEASKYADNHAYARKDSLWYFFDAMGQVLFKTHHVPVGEIAEGLIQVTDGKKYGYLDMQGKVAIPIQFDYQFELKAPFSEGLAVFQQKTADGALKMGYIDKRGKVVVEPEFEYAFAIKNNHALIFRDGKYGCIDKTGKWIVDAKYLNKFSFTKGLAIALADRGNGKFEYELFTYTGDILKTFEAYEGLKDETSFINGLCKLYQPVAPDENHKNEQIRKWGGVKTIYINLKGEVVWESQTWYSCFPGTARVLMADYTEKSIGDVKAGEFILSRNNDTKGLEPAMVLEMQQFEGNFGLMAVYFSDGDNPTAHALGFGQHAMNILELAINHPVQTILGPKAAKNLEIGDKLLFFDTRTGTFRESKIERIIKYRHHTKKLFNLKTNSCNYVVDGVLVNTK